MMGWYLSIIGIRVELCHRDSFLADMLCFLDII